MDGARWNQMCVSEQILNIGGEIQRAVDRKERNQLELARQYLDKAIEWIELTKKDPKNINRISEINVVEEEFRDYFADNKYGNTPKSLMSYWNSFFSAIY